ncbi:MAG: 30S ribosomal protein S2 [Myxococcales bacterium]|nr:30S ribosomal protein S2 [Myxococcales bacterium]
MENVEGTTEQAATASLALPDLIEAGVHFGHQTSRWNPKMRNYIYGSRNGIHIIDLDQTVVRFERAYQFVVDAVARGGHILFVGTKRQAVDTVVEEATRAQQYYVIGRWLGGTLTNFQTMKRSIERLCDLERNLEDGSLVSLPKKEILQFQRERERLEKYLGGIKQMNVLPAALFIIDPSHERIAVNEGRKLGIPIVGVVDTNCDPDIIDYVIPGNDDAIRAIKLITSRIADACLEGLQRRRHVLQNPDAQVFGSGASDSSVQVEFSRGRRFSAPAPEGASSELPPRQQPSVTESDKAPDSQG